MVAPGNERWTTSQQQGEEGTVTKWREWRGLRAKGRWREAEVEMEVDGVAGVDDEEGRCLDRGQRKARSAGGYMRGCVLGSARSKGTFLKPRLRPADGFSFDGNGRQVLSSEEAGLCRGRCGRPSHVGSSPRRDFFSSIVFMTLAYRQDDAAWPHRSIGPPPKLSLGAPWSPAEPPESRHGHHTRPLHQRAHARVSTLACCL
jgi:hypothetical protein